MTVISESPLCLRIHLNRYETKKYFNSYENIAFNNPKVKETAYFLLDTASTGLKFEKNGKLLIEVFPAVSGGCIIKFTSEPGIESFKSSKIKSIYYPLKTKTYVFKFENFEDILNLIQVLILKKIKIFPKSSIYLINKSYYMIVEVPIEENKTILLINEYASFSAKGNHISESIKEHGKCIVAKNAVEHLAKTFFKETLNL